MKKKYGLSSLLLGLLIISLSQTVYCTTAEITKAMAAAPKNNQLLASLVSEETHALLLINNATTLFATWKDNPLVTMWHKKQLQKDYKALRVALQQPRWKRWSKQMFGHSMDELTGLFSGQILLNLPDFPAMSNMQFVADISGKQQEIIDALKTHMQYQQNHLQEGEQYIEEKESFLTTNVHTRRYLTTEQSKEHFSWAIINNFLTISNSKDSLQKLILALDAKKIENNLAESDSFESMSNSHGEYDFLVYLNNSLLASILQEQVKIFEDAGDEESALGNMSEYINNAGLKSVYITAKQQDKDTLLNFSAQYQTDSNFMKLFKVEPQEMKWPVFIDGEPLAASISLFNIANLWQQFISQSETSPLASYIPLVKTELKQLSKNSGVDFEKAITEGMGQTIYSASYKSPLLEAPIEVNTNDTTDDNEYETNTQEDENYLYVFTLQDQQSVMLALNALKKEYNFTSFFTEKKYLSSSIQIYNPYAYKDFSKVNDVTAYVFSNDMLLISNYVPLLENALSQIQHKNIQQSFGHKDEIINFMASLPNNVTGVSYSEGHSFLATAHEILSTLQLFALPSKVQNGCRMRTQPDIAIEEETEEKNALQNVLKSVYITAFDEMNTSRYTMQLNHF